MNFFDFSLGKIPVEFIQAYIAIAHVYALDVALGVMPDVVIYAGLAAAGSTGFTIQVIGICAVL